MIPIDEALKHWGEFDQRWFLVPIATLLVSLFAFGIIVMLPHSAAAVAESTLPADPIAEPAAVSTADATSPGQR